LDISIFFHGLSAAPGARIRSQYFPTCTCGSKRCQHRRL
jgi:hypothetical protein